MFEYQPVVIIPKYLSPTDPPDELTLAAVLAVVDPVENPTVADDVYDVATVEIADAAI